MTKHSLLSEPAWSRFTERRRDAFGLPRMPSLHLPEGDAHEDSGGEAGAAGGGQGGDPGFPANTPVAEMTAEQQAAYWKTQSRKHQQRAEARGDYDDLKTKAARLAELEQQAMTEQERAVAEAREAAKAEGRSEALREANSTAVKAILTAALKGRGKDDNSVAALLRPINFDAYVSDGAPDTDAIAAYVDSIAGPVTGGGSGRGPDHGQGNRGGNSGRATGVSAGAEMFAASRGKKS